MLSLSAIAASALLATSTVSGVHHERQHHPRTKSHAVTRPAPTAIALGTRASIAKPTITMAQGQAAVERFGHDMTNDGSTAWTAGNCTQPDPQQILCDLTQSGFADPTQTVWSPGILVTVVGPHTLWVWDIHSDNRTPPYTIWQEIQPF